MYLIIKVLLSAVIIVAVSEIAKRSTLFGALLASLPLTSLLALTWLYIDTKDTQQVAALATDILWLVLPSLTFFIALPLLLRTMGFGLSMLASVLIMFGAYGVTLLLKRMIS